MLHLVLLLWALPCETQERRPPVIRFNSEVLNRTEVVLSHKKPLTLHCEGDGPVTWHTRLNKQKKLVVNNGNTSVISVGRSKADHTGTYNCSYLSLPELYSSVHVYVRDPNQLFTISTAYKQVKKEGDDCLLPCLLTDPTATGLSLRMNNGSSVPPGMNYSADPRRGILIRNVHPSYNADYVCSAKINGMENISQTFSLNIIQRLYFPPYVFLEFGEYVRIAGEKLQISCKTHNPNFNYNVTWKHNLHSKTIVKENVRSSDRLDIESTLTIPAVNMSDTGNITCIGINEAGVNSSTTYLQVVDKPYLRLSPQLSPKLDREGMVIKIHPGNDLCLGVQIEAFPPITAHRWETPSSNKNSPQENSFYQHNNRYEASILLKRMTAEEQGEYSFYAKSDKADAYITFRVQMYQKPVTTGTSQMNGSSLICTAIGYPAPSIHWFLCPGITTTCSENATEPVPDETMEVQREEYGLVEVKSVLTLDPASHRMTLECVASNLAGEDSTMFSIDVTMRPPLDKLFTPTLAGAAGVSGFFLFLLLILLYKHKQKPRYEIRWKIIEASNGNNYTFIDPLQLPYNEKWEFPRDKLRLGKILGAGAFGKVVEATAYGLGKEDNVTRVAVKMLKPSAHSDEKEALMSELKILSHLGRHQNIVNLLGACTHGGPVLVITEYCRHGDLLNFLRNKAENFLTFVMSMPGFLEETSDYKNISIEKKYIRSDSGISSSCSDNYLEMKPSPAQTTGTSQDPSCEEAEGDTWPLDMDDLLRFSYQVAQGLDFLAAKNCIHRDVAARNVLLTDGCVAKICDFGLARDIMNDSNYVVKGNARLPVKWMAPESIFECVYTMQSDVWSYGILLWEIFSLGKSPYPSMLVDTKFYKMIKCGYQMSRPDFSPPEMYEIMKMCWNLEPTERPTFSKISQLIERLLWDQTEQKTNPSTQMDVLEEQPESREAQKGCEESCDQSCDQEEEELPLMKTNNYQFC